MPFIKHVEGRTKLLVPKRSLAEDPPPTSPIFFNPAASLNRDITVAVNLATGGSTFCDAMAGVGARGLRVANEVRRIAKVTLVDFNSDALRLALRAAVLNGVKRKCEFSVSETCSYLYSRFGRDQKFDYVDVDPFGSPVRQLQAALSATEDGGILSITATDTAVLCGVYPKVSVRRYGASPLNNQFHHETAVRILLGALARLGGPLDTGIESLVAHSTRHYLRVFARVKVGATKADSTLGQLGIIASCKACGHLTQSREPQQSCEKCGGRVISAGPLWLGALTDDGVAVAADEAAQEAGLNRAADVLQSLVGVDKYPPWSYSIDEICSLLKVPTVSESEVTSRLQSLGYVTSRQPFELTGVKTDADFGEVKKVVKSAANELGPKNLAR
ncbi:MAG: methyltransferase domain-containing protein [Thaumarchaeota archaeon]|nr:methyltransferase domain-containing protein [Nitrososphaerota archaeon]